MRFVTPCLAALVVLSFVACTGDDPIGTPSRAADAGADGSVTDAAVSVDGGVPDGGVPDGAAPGDAGSIPVTAGDVVVFTGETLVADGADRITEWRNAILPAGVIAKPVNATGPVKIGLTLPSGALTACAAWSDGDSALSAAPDSAFAMGSDDYSVTAVVQQGPAIVGLQDNGRVVVSIVTPNAALEYAGFALMTEYQDPQRTAVSKAVKFATRISFSGGAAVEVVEPTLSSPGLQVVVAYRRGDAMRLRVGATTYPPVSGASNVLVPTGRPLVLGSTRTDGDPDTRFAGRLCALVIHRGAETDAAIASRADALTARFVP